MANSLTLSSLQTRAGVFLRDTGATVFTAAQIEAAARIALDEYSATLPRTQITVVTGTSGREIDLTAVSAITVLAIWAPYVDDGSSPLRRKFEFWSDLGVAVLIGSNTLVSTDTARVFYTTHHTLNGLDSATVTTIPTLDNSLLLTGTIGHALNSRAIALAEMATVQADAASQLRALADNYLNRFRVALEARKPKEVDE